MSATMTSRIALIALLAAGPTVTWAQTTTPPVTDSTTTQTAPAAEPEVPAQPVEGQITMQSENTVLAGELIGSPVYSTEGQSIGEISDMIVSLDGMVEGVVIGVGGFLGIGEKAVAIEMASLSFMTDPETGETRLQSSATREDLEAAPEFVTMEDQNAAASMPATDATVPADGTAPVGGATTTMTKPADATVTTTEPADATVTTTAPTETTTPPAETTTPPADGTTPPADGAATGTVVEPAPAD